jgi:hypothetical protein
MHAGTTVPVVAVEHPDAIATGLRWIDAKEELTATAGWCTLANAVSIFPDDKLPLKVIEKLLTRLAKEVSKAPNRVRGAMNSFLICTGTYCAPLAEKALETARRIGKVEMDVGDTACTVPDAEPYILKCRRGAPVAPKKKTARC